MSDFFESSGQNVRNKQSFKKDVEEQRASRRIGSERAKAAVQIQRICRGVAGRQKVAQMVVDDFTRKFNDLKKIKELLKANNKAFHFPAELLLNFMGKVHLATTPSGYPAELNELCPFVVDAVQSEFEHSFFAFSLGVGGAAVWHKIRRYIDWLALAITQNGSCNSISQNVCHCLATLLSPSAWPEKHKPPGGAFKGWCDRFYKIYFAGFYGELVFNYPNPTAKNDRNGNDSWTGMASVCVALKEVDCCFGNAHSQAWFELFLIPGMMRAIVLADGERKIIPWGKVLRHHNVFPVQVGTLLKHYYSSRSRRRLKNGSKTLLRSKGIGDRDVESFLVSNVFDLLEAGVVGDDLKEAFGVIRFCMNNVPISVYPNNPSSSIDELDVVKWVRSALGSFLNAENVTQMFQSAFCLTGQNQLLNHCESVITCGFDEETAVALCRVFSSIFLQLENASRSRSNDKDFALQFHTMLCSKLSFQNSGALRSVLWRFANAYCDTEDFTNVPGVEFGQADWIAIVHVYSAVQVQLVHLTSDTAFANTDTSPLPNKYELANYIKTCTKVCITLLKERDDNIVFSSASVNKICNLLSALYRLSLRIEVPGIHVNDFRCCETICDELVSGKHKSLLSRMPQVMPVEARIKILHEYMEGVRIRRNQVRPIQREIRREFLFEDGVRSFQNVQDWKMPFYIIFVNSAGQREPGQDAGGLFKEYWELLVKLAFSPEYGLFCATSTRQLYPNPQSELHCGENHLELFSFLGSILGKAILEGIVVNPQFAIFFLGKLLYNNPSYYDLQFLDKDMFDNLEKLKNYDGDVSDFGLTFSVMHKGKEINLIPNGADIDVTTKRKFEYIYLLSDFKMNKCIEKQSQAFLNGFYKVVDKTWLNMFSEKEVQMLISGVAKGIDVKDLKANTKYIDYNAKSKSVKMFWEIMSKDWDDQMRMALLRFTTSCGRAPLMGFQSMHPPFTIATMPISKDNEKLPMASTCFNILKLPNYSCRKVMRKKLEQAILSGAGFEME